MKKTNLINGTKTLCFSIIFAFAGCGGGTMFQSNWVQGSSVAGTENPIISSRLMTVNDKSSIYFVSVNDSDFAALTFVTNNMMDAVKILRNGMSVTIKQESGKEFSVLFPQAKPMERIPENDRAQDYYQSNVEQKLTAMIANQNEYTIFDDDHNPVNSVSILSSNDIVPTLEYKSGQFIYKLKLPLRKNIDKYLSRIINPGDILSVSVATEERKQKDNKRGRIAEGEGMGEGAESGAGMQGQGGKRNGGRRGGQDGNSEMSRQMMEPIKFDLRVTLNTGTAMK